MKHSVPKGDKRKKKEITLEIAKLEEELNTRHKEELELLARESDLVTWKTNQSFNNPFIRVNLMIMETNSKRISNLVLVFVYNEIWTSICREKKLMQVDFSGGKLGKDHANRPSNR